MNTRTRFELALERLENCLDRLEDHEARIRSLERSWWKFLGATAFATAVAGAILQVILSFR